MNDALVDDWQRDGWLHLRGLFSRAEVERVNAMVAELWQRRPRNITVDDVDLKQRTRMSRLTPAQRAHRIKINDLYLTSPAVRELLLDRRLLEVVTPLLGDAAVLCNSLNLERSSAQEYHADSLYMTPETAGQLVACWIALEDVVEGSGPLRLYPGSHRLPTFPFSGGVRHAVPHEMPRWAEHMQRELDSRNMQPHVIYAKAGDVVLWHGDILHGAEAIADPSLTRRSVVAHYFGRQDCERRGYRVATNDGAHWLQRRPQSFNLPTRILTALERRSWRLRAAFRRR